MKKFALFLLLFSFSSFAVHAESSLKITEIMYDLPGTDSGREWIEVYNAGSADIDLPEFKFFEANTNHGITAVSDSILAPGSFAVIADNSANFSADWPEFSGLIFDSSFSLSNTGEDLAMKDKDGNVVDQVSYDSGLGAAGDEKSLQREGDSFTSGAPTPGESNASEPPPLDEEDPADEDTGGEEPAEDEPAIEESSGGGGSSDDTAPKKAAPKAPKFSIKIDSPANAISNSNFLISALITGADEKLSSKYVWNFGNGEVIETRYNKPFSYSYQFPGSYMITMSYYKDDFSTPVKVSAKIKVEENPISISAVLPDGSIEIKNSATHQADLTGWILKSGLNSFTLPPETILTAGSSVIIPSKVTKFYPGTSNAELFYPSGVLAYSFSKFKPVAPRSQASLGASLPSEEVSVPKEVSDEPIVDGANLSASVINSASDGGSQPLFPWILGLGGIILVSSVISFFVFSGSHSSSSGFKITE